MSFIVSLEIINSTVSPDMQAARAFAKRMEDKGSEKEETEIDPDKDVREARRLNDEAMMKTGNGKKPVPAEAAPAN